MQDSITYPPYGRMVSEWEKLIGAPGEGPAPPDWRPGVSWRDWREDMSDLLGETIWPRYDARKKIWKGAAEAWMHETTLADFAIFPDLLAKMAEDEALPDGTKMAQLKLFRLEDEADAKNDNGEVVLDRSIDATLRLYLAGQLTKAEIDELAKDYIPEGVGRKAGNVDLEIKRDMQRPRPYQIAILLDQHAFSHRHAKSAVTPSMISGHCVEALMAGMAVFYRLNGKLPRPAGAVLDALARHTIDVGDRRVFAGVHYPSDNLSSWLTGLLMCPRVFPDANGGKWIWRAIQRHSRVYAAISEAAPLWEPYRRALDLIDFVAGQKQPTIAEALKFARKWDKLPRALAS